MGNVNYYNWLFFYSLIIMAKKSGKIISIVLFLFLISCDPNTNRLSVNVEDVAVGDVKIKRYAQALFSIDTANLKAELKRLQAQFPVFLDGDLDDLYSLRRIEGFITDTFLIRVQKDCEAKYSNITKVEQYLKNAFQYYKYYYPEVNIPEVFTYVSGFDYEHKIQLYNNNILIALDLYLGSDYPSYKQLGLAKYVFNKFSEEYLVRDCIYEISHSYIDSHRVESALLDLMIYEGKMLWFVHALIPDIKKEILLGYTPEQLVWAKDNEAMVWAFIIENEMLYSTDPVAKQKFIIDAPFTSFFGNDSPPRLGAWIGYHIVDNLMQNNKNISLPELMNNYDSQKILKCSGFKPKM